MQRFDLRPAFIEKPAQGQQVLGGHNSANNCVPDSLLECYQALTGRWPCNPQDITSAVYGPNYIGGETFAAVVTFMRRRPDLFPQLPDIEVHDFGSRVPMDTIGQYGAQGFPMAASFYCDANGKILAYASNILHASCPVASDGSVIAVWNVEGYEVSFNLASFARAYQGALVIFKRAVRYSTTATAGSEIRGQEADLYTPQQKANWLRVTCQQLLGRQPTDEEGKNWAAPVTGELKDDGSNVDACYLKIYNSQESQNYRAALVKALSGGGGAVAVDTSKLSQKGHKHAGGETGPDT